MRDVSPDSGISPLKLLSSAPADIAPAESAQLSVLLQVLQALVERRDLSEELTQEALKVRRAFSLGVNLVLLDCCCTHKCSACSNY